MSVLFNWDGKSLAQQQYLMGVRQIPGSQLVAPGDPFDTAAYARRRQGYLRSLR